MFSCNVFSALHAKHFEIWKKFLWNWWVDCFIAQSIMWYDILGVHSESIFLLMQYFLGELNSSDWLLKSAHDKFSRNNFYFIVVKEFLYDKSYQRYFGEFNWLFSEYYCECQLLWWFEYNWALPWNTVTSKP